MKNLLNYTKPLVLLIVCFYNTSIYADGDESWISRSWFETKNTGISSVQFEQYNELCGTCHFPYQPGLLPAISWEKIIYNLDQHFEQNVKISDVEKRTMLRYVLDNSAGHVNDDLSNKILSSIKYDPIPIRISQTPYIQDKHKQLKQASIVQCDSCHQDASLGLYKKSNIKTAQ